MCTMGTAHGTDVETGDLPQESMVLMRSLERVLWKTPPFSGEVGRIVLYATSTGK